jgi:CBS domain-containing protein
MKTIASDVMTRNVLTIQEGTSTEEVLKILINRKITGMPVVDSQGKMIGIVSEYDIIRQLSSRKKVVSEDFQAPVEYSKAVDSINQSATLAEVVDRFVKAKYRRLPVTDSDGKLLGIITRRDLMRIFYYRAKLA